MVNGEKEMKRLLLFLPILFVCLLLVSFTATAEENTESKYLVTQTDGGYSLYEYEEGAPVLKISASVGEIMSYLGENGDSGNIIFDGISISSPFEFPRGEYTLSGSLSLTRQASITLPSGTSLVLSDFSLSHSGTAEAAVRIKGGSLTVSDSTLSSVGGAVILDYSTESALTLKSGGIYSSSESPAVDLRTGSFMHLGGTVENTAGTAINNDSLLFLSGDASVSGVGYDIVTEKPITLSYSDVGYGGANSLSVSYLQSFEEGSITEVFYLASESAITRIRLYDESGREYPLTYMDKSPVGSEERFAAVYLPFTVKLHNRDGSISSEYKLKGERLDERGAEEIEGYTFLGWYTNREGTCAFSFDSEITESLSLYAIYRLTPPTFSISSVNQVYDKSAHELGFSTLEHPLCSSGGFFSYTWLRDGEVISTESVLTYTTVADSGDYSCEVVFHYNSDTVTVTASNITVTVSKRTVSTPSIPKSYYSGAAQTPGIEPSSVYSATLEAVTDAGVYPVTFTLLDSENYRWESTDAPTVTAYFEILRSENRFTEEIEVGDIYLGSLPSPTALSAFGEVYFIYSSSYDGEYGELLPTEVGNYYVRAVVDESNNYLGIVSEPVPFRVLAEVVTSLTVVTPPSKTSYSAFEYFSPVGLSLLATYNSGRREEINIERVSFTYQNSDSFRHLDNGIILSYGGVSTTLPVSVAKIDYDLSGIFFSDFSLDFDGNYHTYSGALPNIVGRDGIPLNIEVSGGGTNAGEYTLTLIFSTDSQNYNVPKEITAKMTVNRYKTDVLWENLTFTYSGTEHLPTAYYSDVYGVHRRLTVTGGQINAGSGYIAEVASRSDNYIFSNTEVEFEIKKADYDTSGVYWSNTSFTYDSTEKAVTLMGLPSGILVVGYTDAVAVDSGEYTATASVVYDSANYNPPPAFSTVWNIYPASYDMSGAVFSSESFVFDGNIHYPTLVGSMPIGLDGSSPGYSFSGGVTHVSEGSLAVTVSFSTTSKNYLVPKSLTVYLSVTPKEISVNWQSGVYTYSGKYQAPGATAAECEIKVVGGGIDAGDYTATAYTENSDYKIINADLNFSIGKAENFWLTSPSALDIFEGDSLALSYEAYTGEVLLSFFSDLALENKVDLPSTPGKYYVLFTVPESKNYYSLTAPVLQFTVTEVIPVSLSVELLRGGFSAFDRVSFDDLRVTVLYNNGKSIVASDASSLEILYENGTSLRKKDTSISVRLLGLTASLPISVGYASYNPSDFLWENVSFVYDKSAHHPTLVGVPDGVSVVEYVGGNNILAGTYTVLATLSYDSENYSPPPTVSCEYKIDKCVVEAPGPQSCVYNGKLQLPTLDSELYGIENTEGYKNVGEYRLTLYLFDSDNYVFSESGADKQTLTLEILPKSLDVSLSDYDLYLFEDVESVDYILSAGSIIGDDRVEVSYYVDGDKIYLRSENPNYTLVFTPASIVRHNTLSYNARYRLFLIFLLLLLLVLLIIVLVTQRDRIKNAYALAVCRYHNRNVNKNSQNELKSANTPQKIAKSKSQNNSKKSDDVILASDTERESDERKGEKEDGVYEGKAQNDLSETCFENKRSELNATQKDALSHHISKSEKSPSISEDNSPTFEDNSSTFADNSSISENSLPILEEDLSIRDGDESSSSESDCCGDEYCDPDTSGTTATEEKTDNSDVEATVSLIPNERAVMTVDAEHADELITDFLAKDLVKRNREIVYTTGKGKGIINVDTLSENFTSGDKVDVNVLKRHNLVSQDTAYLKVLARGSIDKSLSVYANDFSLSAVKMIALTGGEAIKVVTAKDKGGENLGKAIEK